MRACLFSLHFLHQFCFLSPQTISSKNNAFEKNEGQNDDVSDPLELPQKGRNGDGVEKR